ncbi:MAG: gliding motility lipoprotein GldH [Bacteroidales bacterium]|nr:gliding motility lipoprotein GldH [Bacteroidales bacterium]MBN2698779.1 gliding motility lipoprotein GldH [Bacteroidales bacterium]
MFSPKKVLLWSVILVSALSCRENVVFDEFSHIGKPGWNWSDKRAFDIEPGDTTQMHDIYIQVRHTVDYPMSNLYMFVNVYGPSGQSMKDTVNMILAEPDGRWVGRGPGKIRELRFHYRKNTIFSEPGTYRFILEQGMRVPSLPVTDVGIRITKSQ